MADPVPEDLARNRFLIINMVRLTGVLLILVAMLGLQGVIALPDIVAYLFVAVGLVDVFLVPTVLARKWATRSE